MNYLDSVIDRDTLYWIVGVAVPILLTILFFVIFRLGRRLPEKTELPAASLPPAQPIQEDQIFTTTAKDPAAERLTRDRIPENESLPAADLKEAAIPFDDVPADIAARKGGSLPENPAVRPHTPEEIQKAAPKPLFAALSNTRSSFFGRIKGLFAGRPAIQANELEDLEEILYTSDLGPQTVQRLLEAVETRLKADGSSGFEAVREALKAEMIDIFESVPDGNGQPQLTSVQGGKVNGVDSGAGGMAGQQAHLKLVTDADEDHPHVHHGSEEYLEGLDRLAIWDHKPAVIMVVGVNGAGKTTTIGKMARRLAQSGRKVLVAAGDTFRAAAGDQLRVWTERAQVEIFSPEGVTDPSAVAYMATEKAQAGGFDVVIVDTAGRLHTQKNLMEELKKMKRVIQKLTPEAPHEVLLVLDSNSGQNALIQAREFHQALGVTGVVLTKLDGTAKGGVAVGVACELHLPIKMIGVGEGVDDLRRFSAREFVDSIL